MYLQPIIVKLAPTNRVPSTHSPECPYKIRTASRQNTIKFNNEVAAKAVIPFICSQVFFGATTWGSTA